MNNIIDFYDIYDYYTIPFWQTTWFKVIIGLGVIAIALACFFILRKKKVVTAWEWANAQLKNLSMIPLNNKDDYKKFYCSLTTLIKSYLHRRYDWKLDDKTDEEVVAWLEEQQFDPEVTAMLKNFTQGALWVKFANADALQTQTLADIKTVAAMIEKTAQHYSPASK